MHQVNDVSRRCDEEQFHGRIVDRDEGAGDKVDISRQEDHHVEDLGFEADPSC